MWNNYDISNVNVELFVNILKDISLFYFHYTVMLLYYTFDVLNDFLCIFTEIIIFSLLTFKDKINRYMTLQFLSFLYYMMTIIIYVTFFNVIQINKDPF